MNTQFPRELNAHPARYILGCQYTNTICKYCLQCQRLYFCCLVLVASIINSTLTLQMSAHISRGFNLHPARRILGHQCSNPNCLFFFANQHACDLHRNHETRKGTLCASITMGDEVTRLHRSDTSTAVLSTRRSTGWTMSTWIASLTDRSAP